MTSSCFPPFFVAAVGQFAPMNYGWPGIAPGSGNTVETRDLYFIAQSTTAILQMMMLRKKNMISHLFTIKTEWGLSQDTRNIGGRCILRICEMGNTASSSLSLSLSVYEMVRSETQQ